jgi:hypothetical protein
MGAQQVWIAANLVNVAALVALIAVFARRYLRATRTPHPDAPVPPRSVREQRRLNAASARNDMLFYGALATLGLAMIAAALLWDRATPQPVPWLIPGGTVFFAAIYLAKALARAWEGVQRERIADLAEREAANKEGC